mmetsp:Transcript_115476/g.321716  ORF Transcript_115476/g.321716 Transcript_115476/m.321716 type:complete len:128 (+) Transcript_115476:3-386(+)
MADRGRDTFALTDLRRARSNSPTFGNLTSLQSRLNECRDAWTAGRGRGLEAIESVMIDEILASELRDTTPRSMSPSSASGGMSLTASDLRQLDFQMTDRVLAQLLNDNAGVRATRFPHAHQPHRRVG